MLTINALLITIGASSFGGLLIGMVIFYYINRFLQRFRMSRRVGESLIAQEEAEELLKQHNFKIVARQKRADIITYIDGKPNISYVQADYIVERKGKYYVAEAKAGEINSSATDPATRRQLMEYKFAYQPDGMILVDMLERKLHFVNFYLPEKEEDKLIKIVIWFLVACIVIALLWLFISIKII